MPLDDPIYIFDYDQRWPARAKRHTDAIAAALGENAVLIEHIGSTAVPGLAAKPILDLIVGHASPGLTARTVTRLTRLGYVFYGDQGVPGRGFFRSEPTPDGEPAVHIHVFPQNHPALQRDIAFRDTLRADPGLAMRYQNLKRALALKYRHDLDGYNRGKESFIVRVVGSRTAAAAWEQPVTPAADGGLSAA